MKTILALCLILCCCVSAEAGGFRRNNANRNFNRGFNAGFNAANGNRCGNGFNQFRSFNRFNGGFGGTTVIRERSIGPFGLFGSSRTVIQQ